MYTINFWHVLITAFVSMVIGALWYSPVLFGKLWIRLSGFSEADIALAKQKKMTKEYTLSFVGVLIMSYVLAHFVQIAQAVTFGQGMQLGFWIWLGFVVTSFLNSVLWEGKSWQLYALNISHYLVVLVLAGGILAAWS